jgi:hypothetical protein
MDAARHHTVLESIGRQLEQVLDESAGQIGHEAAMYRAML